MSKKIKDETWKEVEIKSKGEFGKNESEACIHSPAGAVPVALEPLARNKDHEIRRSKSMLHECGTS